MQIEQFKKFLALRGLSKASVRRQTDCLCKINLKTQSFTQEEIDNFLFGILNEYKKSSYNYFVVTIRNYAKMINSDVTARYLRVDDTKAIQVLTPEQIKKLLTVRYPNKGSRKNWDKWTLFLTICAYTGLRGNEVARIKKGEVNLTSREIVIPKTKNGKPHWVPIHPIFEDMLVSWITLFQDSDYIFALPSGRVPTANSWDKVLKNRLKLAGITTKISLHNLRDSFATTLSNEDVDINKISKLLNHSDLRSTQKYIHLAHKNLLETSQKHPNIVESMSEDAIIKAIERKVREVNIPTSKFDKFKVEKALIEFLEKIHESILEKNN